MAHPARKCAAVCYEKKAIDGDGTQPIYADPGSSGGSRRMLDASETQAVAVKRDGQKQSKAPEESAGSGEGIESQNLTNTGGYHQMRDNGRPA